MNMTIKVKCNQCLSETDEIYYKASDCTHRIVREVPDEVELQQVRSLQRN